MIGSSDDQASRSREAEAEGPARSGAWPGCGDEYRERSELAVAISQHDASNRVPLRRRSSGMSASLAEKKATGSCRAAGEPLFITLQRL